MNTARAWADYGSAEAHKLLADHRELYIAQSAATRDGNVAPFPARSPAVTARSPHAPAAGFSLAEDAE